MSLFPLYSVWMMRYRFPNTVNRGISNSLHSQECLDLTPLWLFVTSTWIGPARRGWIALYYDDSNGQSTNLGLCEELTGNEKMISLNATGNLLLVAGHVQCTSPSSFPTTGLYRDRKRLPSRRSYLLGSRARNRFLSWCYYYINKLKEVIVF